MNFAGKKQALITPLLVGGLGAGFADTVAHDDLDHVVDKYKDWYKAKEWGDGGRITQAYTAIMNQGPFGILDFYGIAAILAGKKNPTDPSMFTDEQIQNSGAVRAGLVASNLLGQMTPQEIGSIEKLLVKEGDLFVAEQLAAVKNNVPVKGNYDPKTVMAAAEAGEGTSATPAIVGGLSAGTGAALGRALAQKLSAR
tara:strand:+ start:12628 stop:13218 length:591 start_codon:yes stop_codon:yes gene_type:complete